jgi:DNA replication protein DnaC
MTDDPKEAQRMLEQRRRSLGIDRPPAPRWKPKRDTFDDPRRLVQLEAKAREELAAEGMDPDLFAALALARARQLLRAEKDPAWVEGLRAAERAERAADLRAQMKSWRFPDFAVEAIIDGRNDKGEPLATSQADRFIRTAMGVPSTLFVVLVGLLGTGKTLAACRWAVGLIGPPGASRPDVIYCRALEIFSRSPRQLKDRQWLRRVETCDVLVVDECGTDEEREGDDSPQLAGLWLRRFDDNRRTVVLANLTQEHFETRYDQAIMSRLYHRGGLEPCTEVMRRGEKRRQRQQQKGKGK